MLSNDYDKSDRKTELLFAETKNKLLFTATRRTATEIITERTKADLLNLSLTARKGSQVRKEDVINAKNYLPEDEIDTLNRLVVLFPDTAELRVKEQIPLSTDFWRHETGNVIQFSRKQLLLNKESVSREQAKAFVETQYAAFDAERKKTETLNAGLEDQKALEELIRKTKKK